MTLLLRRYNADLNAKDIITGRTPLHLASSNGLLISTNKIKTYLNTGNVFSISGHKDVVALLVLHGADIEARDNDGKIPCDLIPEKGKMSTQMQHIRFKSNEFPLNRFIPNFQFGLDRKAIRPILKCDKIENKNFAKEFLAIPIALE